MSPDTAGRRRRPETTDAHLRARFRVEPRPEGGCALLAAGESGHSVRQNVVDDDGECRCLAEATVAGEEYPQLLGGEIGEGCICPIFDDYDCVRTIEGFDDGELILSLSTTDRATLSEIVGALREAGAGVRLERISQSEGGRDEPVLELEANGVTEKQREAVRVAVENGYYDRPRRTDLGGLADELDISKSAVSQRLSAVESKLVSELFDTVEGTYG